MAARNTVAMHWLLCAVVSTCSSQQCVVSPSVDGFGTRAALDAQLTPELGWQLSSECGMQQSYSISIKAKDSDWTWTGARGLIWDTKYNTFLVKFNM